MNEKFDGSIPTHLSHGTPFTTTPKTSYYDLACLAITLQEACDACTAIEGALQASMNPTVHTILTRAMNEARCHLLATQDRIAQSLL